MAITRGHNGLLQVNAGYCISVSTLLNYLVLLAFIGLTFLNLNRHFTTGAFRSTSPPHSGVEEP